MLVHDFCVWLRDPLAVLLAPTERPSVCSAARASRGHVIACSGSARCDVTVCAKFLKGMYGCC